jgi:hypothetical protein
MHAHFRDDTLANLTAILFGVCTLVASGFVLASTL